MILKKWEEIPIELRNESVRKYYEILQRKKLSLFLKQVLDIVFGIVVLIFLLPLILILCIIIKIDSKGPIFYRQVRITQYRREFRIIKFRTMVNNADQQGLQVTTFNDSRVTKIGKILRKYRLDEIPQILNIIARDMSFVGTRPEVLKYVEKYSDEMLATLLLPAGVTSEASIMYRDEEKLLHKVDSADETYVDIVLPEKMKFNLRSLEKFSFITELKTMVRTILVVIKND